MVLVVLSLIGTTSSAAAQEATGVIVGVTDVRAEGGLPTAAAFEIVQAHLPELAACLRHERAADNVPERAELDLRLAVSAGGEVHDAQVADATDPDDRAHACLRERSLAWRFPAQEAGESVVAAHVVFGTRPDVDAETVEAVVRRHLSEVRTCAIHQRAAGARGGRVTLELEVSSTGRVQATQVHDSSLGDPEADRCIEDAARSWTFPLSPRQDVLRIRYPFVLGGSRGDQYVSRSLPKTTSPP